MLSAIPKSTTLPITRHYIREHVSARRRRARPGYRSHTIGSLLVGKKHSEIAVTQAYAHLRHCHACQVHRVLAVLPLPVVLASRSSLPSSLRAGVLRIGRFFQRGTVPQRGVRERAMEVIAGSSAGAKIAAGVVSVVLLTGGIVSAIGVTHAHVHKYHRPDRRYRAIATLQAHPRLPFIPARDTSPSGPARSHPPRWLPRPSEQRTAGGFAYLGIASPPHPRSNTLVVVQHSGGPRPNKRTPT